MMKMNQESTQKAHLWQTDYTSFDAPPLDFSFKNIKTIEQLLELQPRQGHKKVSIINPSTNIDKKISIKEGKDGLDKNNKNVQKKKEQLVLLVPQQRQNNIVQSMINSSQMKNISLKAKQDLQKKRKKSVYVKLICSSLVLSYNRIRQIAGLNSIIVSILDKCEYLQCIDVSHNYLSKLDYDFKEFPQLKSLSLHANFIADLGELEKISHLQELICFTIHGNPLEQIPNFRLLTISIFPQIKKIDSVLVSKKQKDNSIFIRSQTKKYATVKNPLKPPKEVEDQQMQNS